MVSPPPSPTMTSASGVPVSLSALSVPMIVATLPKQVGTGVVGVVVEVALGLAEGDTLLVPVLVAVGGSRRGGSGGPGAQEHHAGAEQGRGAGRQQRGAQRGGRTVERSRW